MPSNNSSTHNKKSSAKAKKRERSTSSSSNAKQPARSTSAASNNKPVVTAAPVTAPVVAASGVPTSRDLQAQKRQEEFQTTFNGITELIANITSETQQVKKQMVKLQKLYAKEQALLEKHTKKKVRSKTLSGFAKPGYISRELCQFLKMPADTEMARTDVTKYLTKYIEEHKLQDQENKRVIKPNTELAQLLDAGAEDEITYFNLQSYMKRHYADPNKASKSGGGKAGASTSS